MVRGSIVAGHEDAVCPFCGEVKTTIVGNVVSHPIWVSSEGFVHLHEGAWVSFAGLTVRSALGRFFRNVLRRVRRGVRLVSWMRS